jgi:hypothetical protein
MALPTIAVDSVAQSIQLAVAPVFLLTAVGSLLNVLVTRLARITDRARKIESDIGGYRSDRRTTAISELAILDRRMAASHWAIALCTCSALLVCIVVAILFVGEVATLRGTYAVPALFVGAMALLISGLVLFLYEIQIALRSVRVRAALLVDSID